MPGFERLGQEERREISEVLDKNILFRYEFGPQRGEQWKVRQFEEQLASYVGVPHALAVSSGTAALKVAMAGLGIGPGDEVIVPGFTFVATWEAVLEAGAEPVFAEIDDSLCLDPQLIESKITPRTRAVCVVHMCGGQADIEAVAAVARKHNLLLIEDTCQAMGARIGGRHLGTWGDVATLSFDAVKTVTTGEGGAVLCRDATLNQTLIEYHDHGHDHRPVGRGNEGHPIIGFNYRMGELQGALGLVQLRRLDEMLATQRRHKARLRQILSRVPGLTFRRYMDEAGDSATFVSWFHRDAAETERFNQALTQAGCGAVYWFKHVWHYYRCWEHLHQAKTTRKSGWPFVREDGRRLVFKEDALPVSDAIMARHLCWQVMLNMTEERFGQIEAAVEKAARAV